MNFSEKIKKLRKENNLTQEELADKLFISRTAISKWESGKGYPSIDLLKQISKEFNVSVDNLLSSEQVLEIVEIDKKNKIKKISSILFAVLDLMILFLIFLPLYGMEINNYVYSVSLLSNNNLIEYIKILYLVSYFVIFLLGIIEIIMFVLDNYKLQKITNILSLLIQFIILLLLIITKEPYACSLVLILFIVKFILLAFKEKTVNTLM